MSGIVTILLSGHHSAVNLHENLPNEELKLFGQLERFYVADRTISVTSALNPCCVNGLPVSSGTTDSRCDLSWFDPVIPPPTPPTAPFSCGLSQLN